MLRTFLLLLLASWLVRPSYAQHTGPTAQYRVESISTQWQPLGTSAQRFAYSNPLNGYGIVTLPFDFPYDDSVLKQGSTIYVCSNGVVSLSSQVAPDSNVAGDAGFPGALCIFSGNMTSGDNGNLWDSTQVTGVSPNRVFTIQYHSVHFPKSGAGQGRGASTSMQVKLYESGAIEFLYRDHNLSFSDTSSIRCGIGINGGMTGAFTSNVFTESTKSTPSTDVRWVPNTSTVKNSNGSAEISIFPNPASNSITIEDVGASRLVAVDELGRENELAVVQRGSQSEVNTSKLPAGTYILRIEHGAKVMARRILIAR